MLQMQRTPEELVRLILAEHLEVEPNTIQPNLNLETDLGLTPLAVVIVVLDLEDLESMYMPLDRLFSVKTVADLAAFLASARVASLSESEYQMEHSG
jgi:acyl carrier protein